MHVNKELLFPQVLQLCDPYDLWFIIGTENMYTVLRNRVVFIQTQSAIDQLASDSIIRFDSRRITR